MATLVTITADKEDENLIADGFDIMKSVEMSLSSYDPKANVFLLNKNLHAQVDNYLYEALLLSKEYYEKTDGYFDITVGSITKDLYRFGEDERVATLDELDGAKVGFKALWFDADKVFFDKKGSRLIWAVWGRDTVLTKWQNTSEKTAYLRR